MPLIFHQVDSHHSASTSAKAAIVSCKSAIKRASWAACSICSSLSASPSGWVCCSSISFTNANSFNGRITPIGLPSVSVMNWRLRIFTVTSHLGKDYSYLSILYLPAKRAQIAIQPPERLGQRVAIGLASSTTQLPAGLDRAHRFIILRRGAGTSGVSIANSSGVRARRSVSARM